MYNMVSPKRFSWNLRPMHYLLPRISKSGTPRDGVLKKKEAKFVPSVMRALKSSFDEPGDLKCGMES